MAVQPESPAHVHESSIVLKCKVSIKWGYSHVGQLNWPCHRLSGGVIGGDPQKVSTQRFYLTGENRETHRLADSDTGSPAISGVRQLSDQWSFHTEHLHTYFKNSGLYI
ncbi:hypothetical protein OIU84_024986 [Salix udensis]|uniref:Uncharacterized protein n=1 Tax=Salix udensis TaxID=889485 RepID=A0AAD6KKR6_9ROSI|nr:hypothetical protein OIU84_024986 [Salix udensis]